MSTLPCSSFRRRQRSMAVGEREREIRRIASPPLLLTPPIIPTGNPIGRSLRRRVGHALYPQLGLGHFFRFFLVILFGCGYRVRGYQVVLPGAPLSGCENFPKRQVWKRRVPKSKGAFSRWVSGAGARPWCGKTSRTTAHGGPCLKQNKYLPDDKPGLHIPTLPTPRPDPSSSYTAVGRRNGTPCLEQNKLQANLTTEQKPEKITGEKRRNDPERLVYKNTTKVQSAKRNLPKFDPCCACSSSPTRFWARSVCYISRCNSVDVSCCIRSSQPKQIFSCM
jgi:hypothetical protein